MSTHSARVTPAEGGPRSAVSWACIGLGVATVAVGVVITLLGLSGASAFDVSVKSFAFDSTSTGLGVIALGGSLIAGVSLDRPDSGYRYRPATASATERRQRQLALVGIAVMALDLLLYVASILF